MEILKQIFCVELNVPYPMIFQAQILFQEYLKKKKRLLHRKMAQDHTV